HDVLELVAKTVGSARLVEPRAPPQAAGKRLVEEPVIQHDVERPVRSLDLYGRQEVVPAGGDGAEHRVQVAGAGAPDDRARLVDRRALTEEDDDFGAGARGEQERHLQRPARIQAAAQATREALAALERIGVIEGAVAPEDLGAIARPRRLPAREIEERDAPGEVE